MKNILLFILVSMTTFTFANDNKLQPIDNWRRVVTANYRMMHHSDRVDLAKALTYEYWSSAPQVVVLQCTCTEDNLFFDNYMGVLRIIGIDMPLFIIGNLELLPEN